MPPYAVPVAAFAQDLVLRRHNDHDYAVTIEAAGIGTLAVGRVMIVARPLARSAWRWSVTGPVGVGAGIGLHGEADTR